MELEPYLSALITCSSDIVHENSTVFVFEYPRYNLLKIIIKAVSVSKRKVTLYYAGFYPIRFFKIVCQFSHTRVFTYQYQIESLLCQLKANFFAVGVIESSCDQCPIRIVLFFQSLVPAEKGLRYPSYAFPKVLASVPQEFQGMVS